MDRRGILADPSLAVFDVVSNGLWLEVVVQFGDLNSKCEASARNEHATSLTLRTYDGYSGKLRLFQAVPLPGLIQGT